MKDLLSSWMQTPVNDYVQIYGNWHLLRYRCIFTIQSSKETSEVSYFALALVLILPGQFVLSVK